ncbi:MAG: hypothetical protein AB7H97_11420 [Pseudobdellovibrionaceae bacterium]
MKTQNIIMTIAILTAPIAALATNGADVALPSSADPIVHAGGVPYINSTGHKCEDCARITGKETLGLTRRATKFDPATASKRKDDDATAINEVPTI